MRVRQALRADIPGIADVWVDAFATDPFLRWMGGDDDTTWPAFGRDWMTFIAEQCFERGHCHVTEPAGGAVTWIPPDLSFVGPDDVARGVAIIARHAGEERSQAALATISVAGGHSIEEPHWTLQYIGIDSAHRGQGLGAELVAPYLSRFDDDGLPCGLVSSNPRNVSFYERVGFTVVAEVSTPDGAATIRPMRRPAAGS